MRVKKMGWRERVERRMFFLFRILTAWGVSIFSWAIFYSGGIIYAEEDIDTHQGYESVVMENVSSESEGDNAYSRRSATENNSESDNIDASADEGDDNNVNREEEVQREKSVDTADGNSEGGNVQHTQENGESDASDDNTTQGHTVRDNNNTPAEEDDKRQEGGDIKNNTKENNKYSQDSSESGKENNFASTQSVLKGDKNESADAAEKEVHKRDDDGKDSNKETCDLNAYKKRLYKKSSSDIIIAAVAIHDKDDALIIKNTTDHTVDITGWHVRRRTATKIIKTCDDTLFGTSENICTFGTKECGDGPVRLPAHGMIVIARADGAYRGKADFVRKKSFADNNAIILLDNQRVLRDIVAWGHGHKDAAFYGKIVKILLTIHMLHTRAVIHL